MRDFRVPGDGIGKAGIGTASGSLAPGKRTLTEARLDHAWSVLVLPGAEWVWPARGMIVVVKDNVGAVLRTGLFVPGTLAEYRRVARYLEDEREEPGD